jgi:cbb3-type cytochrome oxidase subunit 3
MTMALLIRFIIFCSILLIGFLVIRYILNPKRKLELAHENKELYLLDDFKNVRKNLLVTQRGVLFEGEKYLGTTDNAFRVVHIKLWPHKNSQLHGLGINDFVEIEEKVFKRYPYATIEWGSPVKELMKEL